MKAVHDIVKVVNDYDLNSKYDYIDNSLYNYYVYINLI